MQKRVKNKRKDNLRLFNFYYTNKKIQIKLPKRCSRKPNIEPINFQEMWNVDENANDESYFNT